jgi:predicted phage replisome organizer
LADVKWIKITTDIFDDEKILMIESMPSADSIIVIWLKLLTFAGKQNNDGVFLMSNRIAYTDEMLACIFRRDVNLVRMALKIFEQFGMIEIIEKVITIPNWNKHQTLDAYEKKKERDRLYKQERRAKQRLLAAGSSDKSSDSQPDKSSDVVVSDKEEDKEKEREIDKKNSAKQPSKADVDSFFESVWNLYPVKKGKGQVSETKRKVLYKIGYDNLERAINRYLTELKKDASWRKPQNGSTFFNSGYVDYLDENYAPDQTVMGGRTEKLPEWFGRRELDDDEKAAIQRMMSKDDQEEAEQLRRELQESFGRR